MTWCLDQLPPENRGTHRIHLPVLRWTFLPGGSDLLITTTNHTVVRVASPAFDAIEPFKGAGDDCAGAQAFSTRHQYIVFHENGDITIHDLEKHELKSRWHVTDQKFLGIGLLPKTEDIIVVTADFRGHTIDSKNGKIISEWAVPDWGFTQQLSEDGKTLWLLAYDGSVSIIRVYDGQTTKTRFDHGNTVSLAFNPEVPELLATCSDTGFVRLVSRQTLQTLQVLGRYRLAVWSACFAPGERLATVGNGDEDLKLWDLRTGRELFTLTSDETHGNPVKVSPDGSTFAQFGVPEGELYVWRAPSWDEIKQAGDLMRRQ
jgi:WD40 repeat protein